jgi:biotin transport system substrate-specific component
MSTTKTAQADVSKRIDTKTIAIIGLMTAVICILGPLSMPIPISPVPISLCILGIYLAVYVLGMKKGTVSVLVYLLMGFVGIPVFSSFSSGPAKLLGPTGGYLIGYIFLALICGFFIDRWDKRLIHFGGMVLGCGVCYAFGTAWLAYQAGMTFYAALWAGVIPYIPGDLIKMAIALIIGPEIRKRLKKSGLLA